MRERRRYPRYNTNLQARYLYIRGMVALEEETRLSDLSVAGMRIYLSSIVKRGDVFIVEMKLPFIGTISAMARVIWTKAAGNTEEAGHAYRQAGVLFEWVSNENKLQDYLEELQLKAA
ncbi:MAG: PilZ domain-containing protein [Candidatus Omnitrophota bacterium]